MDITVDLEVFKALTERLEFEGQTHNDLLRELLNLDSIAEEDAPEPAILSGLEAFAGMAEEWRRPRQSGFYSRGLFLPDGTLLRSRYKGSEYSGCVRNGKWLDADGCKHDSPSAAATAITGNNVNGLRFWEARRPQDNTWRRLEFLRR
ncbi:hypothetical protein [Parasphingorhabdus sp.]|uniref:hypothetical protein n=1 Tax=Parasphingorhabdus sp. TaxID=2709688 RepID=UPI003A8CD283